MPDKAVLFADKHRMNQEALRQMQQSVVEVEPYDSVGSALAKYGEYNILMDEGETAYTLYNKAHCVVSGSQYSRLTEDMGVDIELGDFL